MLQHTCVVSFSCGQVDIAGDVSAGAAVMDLAYRVRHAGPRISRLILRGTGLRDDGAATVFGTACKHMRVSARIAFLLYPFWYCFLS